MDVLHITDSQSLSFLSLRRPAAILITLPFETNQTPESLLAQAQSLQPGIPVAFYRENGPANEAIRLIRLGAAEYFDDLASAHSWQPRPPQIENTNEPWRAFLIGDCPAMHPVFDTIRILGPRRSTVLIQGETGTGKEMVARAIHRQHPRGGAHCLRQLRRPARYTPRKRALRP